MPTLNLVVIARNESRCIRRCLDSARPFVDRMIVLDTQSTDDTPQLAQAAGAQVASFEWTGSFSDARNAALQMSEADWNLVLDADEWIEEPSGWGNLRATLADQRFIGLIRVRNQVNIGPGVELADSWIPRLLPRGVRYVGRIHEQPVSNINDERVDLAVHHDGYLTNHALDKHPRNHILLKIAMEESPQNAYLAYQFGVQCEVVEDWRAASDAYDRCRSLGGHLQSFAHELGFRHIHALSRTGQYERALQLGLELRDKWPDSTDIHFAFGNVCMDLAAREPSRAIDTWLPAAEAAWQTCLKIGEHATTPTHVVGRGSHLPAHNLAVIYEGLGMHDAAAVYRKMIPSHAQPALNG